jgi:putative membrane protein
MRRRLVGRDWLPPTMLGIFVLVWSWAAWHPIHFGNWLLENLLVFAFVPVLLLTFRRFRFSDLSYVLFTVFLSLHVIGSHWSYSNVPWPDWKLLGFERNHYDRVVHFAYGLLLVVPGREVLMRVFKAKPGVASYIAVEATLATSALYEIIEWLAVMVVAPDMGAAFLGTQGDEFDAVVDIALAGAGALVTVAVIEVARRVRPSPRAASTF